VHENGEDGNGENVNGLGSLGHLPHRPLHDGHRCGEEDDLVAETDANAVVFGLNLQLACTRSVSREPDRRAGLSAAL
jgi:hypothetical protein